MDVIRTVRYQGSIGDLKVLLKAFNDEGVHAEFSLPDPQEEKRRQQERHQQELGQLQERHQQELRELQERHQRELQFMQEVHRLEQDEPVLAGRLTGQVVSDLNQLAINLVSTGAAGAIAMAVKKFLKRKPHAKVEVKGEPPIPEDNCPPSPQPHPG
jgi:hypothetical protein